MYHTVCFLLSFLKVSQKAMLLMCNNKFHQSLVSYFHKPRTKTNELIFRKFCPKCEKIAKPCQLAWYCGKSSGSFETLLKLVHGILDDDHGYMAGLIFFALNKFSLTIDRMLEKSSQIFDT